MKNSHKQTKKCCFCFQKNQTSTLHWPLTNVLCNDFQLKLTNLRSQLVNLRSQLTNLRSQLINLRSQLTNLRSQLINLRSQLNNWQSQLTNLQSFKVTKMAGRLVCRVCFIVMTLPSSYYTLPNYLPTLRHGNQERNSLIEEYFRLGFNYSEMLSFLLLYHGVRLSLRQLERILRSRGLRRRKILSGINRVENAIDQELQSSDSCIGYRLLKVLLRSKLHVRYETKMRSLWLIRCGCIPQSENIEPGKVTFFESAIMNLCSKYLELHRILM